MALIIFSVFSAYVLCIPTEAFLETRNQALIRALVRGQKSDGAYPPFSRLFPGNESCLPCTAEVITICDQLGSLNLINTGAAIEYILANQNQTTGSFSNHGSQELYTNWLCVNALIITNSIDRCNSTSLELLILNHYNETSGAFYEPDGSCSFDMWRGEPYPFDKDNMISTHLGISILKSMDSLDIINTSKTLSWVYQSKGPDGGFRPFPNATDNSGGFFSGAYGTGLPYTYCALMILEDLDQIAGYIEMHSNDTIDFVWGCQTFLGDFHIITNSDPHSGAANDPPHDWETFYAIRALDVLGGLDESEEGLILTLDTTLDRQLLDYQYRIYLPDFLARCPHYGLFGGEEYDIGGTYGAVNILSLTGTLEILDSFTPRSIAAISTVIFILVFAIILGSLVLLAYRHGHPEA